MGSPMSGVDADVYMAASPSVLVASETCNNTDAGVWIAYVAATHKFWDKKQPLVVQCSPNGSSGWVTVTDYVFQYAGGVIIFNTARVAATNNFVRIFSGYYWNLTELDDATAWSLTLKADTAETTAFQSGGWARNIATIKKGTGKIESVRNDGRIFLELGNMIALQLYISKIGNDRWDAIGIVTGLDPKSTAKGIQEQSMSFDVEGDCYLRLV